MKAGLSASGFGFVLLFLCADLLAQGGPPSIVESARKQIGETVRYDPEYVILSYPGGDVPPDRGVCTDVVIRALRDSLRIDLQKLVHEDMRANFSAYPRLWSLSRPDKNIDHRRVPNLQTYFGRKGFSLKITDKPGNFCPGDIVTVMLPRNLPHIMIVSDRKNASGIPLAIHNIGQGTREEDTLFAFPITGHYRVAFPAGDKSGASPPP